MKNLLYLILATLGLLAMGCTAYVKKDPKQLIDKVMPEIAETWDMAGVEQRIKQEPIGWIDRLKDPILKELIHQAEAQNPSLRLASYNINRARALAKQAGAALSPQVGAGLGSQNGGPVDGSADSQLSLGLNLSWEWDLWGRLKARRNAAEESLAAVEADFRAARNLLAASTAKVYFVAIEAEQQRVIASQQVSSMEEILRIVKARSENGMASEQDVSLSLSDLASAKNNLAKVEAACRDTLRALEVLLGKYPVADRKLPKGLPGLPRYTGAGLPSNLLERRPDLVASERRVAAALNLLNEAKAARLPSFKLSTDIGGVSNGLSNILSSSKLSWAAANSLLAPLYSGGALKAQVSLASIDVEMALANYVDTALKAFSEVETALDQSTTLVDRERLLFQAKSEAQKAFDLEKIRHQEGETGLLDLLTIQQRTFTAQSNYLAVKRGRLDQYVALNLALGGDW